MIRIEAIPMLNQQLTAALARGADLAGNGGVKRRMRVPHIQPNAKTGMPPARSSRRIEAK